jgi:hypothetical protein
MDRAAEGGASEHPAERAERAVRAAPVGSRLYSRKGMIRHSAPAAELAESEDIRAYLGIAAKRVA